MANENSDMGTKDQPNLLAEAVLIIESFLHGTKPDIENDAMIFLRKSQKPTRKTDFKRAIMEGTN